MVEVVAAVLQELMTVLQQVCRLLAKVAVFGMVHSTSVEPAHQITQADRKLGMEGLNVAVQTGD